MSAQIKSVLLNLIRGCLFITPFIPLYISQKLFFPYITGKAFALRILVEVAFAAWVWLAFTYEEYRPRFSPVLIAISFWILIVSAATLFGINPLRSFWSNFERMEGLVAYIHWFAYFIVITSVFNLKDWMKYLNLFIISGIYENAYVFLQWMGILASPQGGTGRADGTIGNPTYVAAYLIFILGISAFLWLKSNKETWLSYFYAGMGAWTVLSIYFTASRGPVLGLLIGLILAALAYLIFSENSSGKVFNRKIVGIGLALLVVIPFSFWLLRETNFVKSSPALSRLTSLSLSERTIVSRFSIWSMSFEGFKERPILGWGPENYAVVFSKYFLPELWRQEPWFDRSHNIIFDWLINAGILGLMSYLGILASAFYMLWKSYSRRYFSLEESLLFMALLLAYFFQNLFVFDNSSTYLAFFAVLGFTHFSFISSIPKIGQSESSAPAISRPRSNKNSISEENEIFYAVFSVGIAASLFFVVYFVNISPLLANLNLLEALRSQSQNPELVFNQYQKALSYGYLGNQEAREQMTKFAIAVGSSPNLPIEFKDKVIRATLIELEKSVNENPLDPRPYLFLSGLYGRVGFYDQALALSNEALRLSPKKQQIYFEIADLYMQKRDYKSSVGILEKAFELDQEYNQALSNLVGAYILNGEQKKADDLLIKSFGTVDVPDQILVQVYSNVRNYKRLIGVWRAYTERNPKNLDYRKSLAGAYLLNGDKGGAIQVLNDAIKDFPEFSKEGEDLIRQSR